ncbi:DUF917 domain-containing protein [Paraburkholderia sediminicola]|uniref:DUF917 domain-containing protein n=1 Tax=Paraburkholderia sediminicola TaxID=458836 RepID=UPI0038B77997
MTALFDAITSQDLARGAVFLGTGGGGDPYVGELFLRKQLAAGLQPRLVPVESLADDAFIATIAGIGAPTVLVEHLVSEAALKTLLKHAEALYGRPLDAIISAEIGGANAMFPLAISAMMGLPVVDGDGIGRAFPHIEMTTFSIHGCQACPAIFADDLGNHAVVHATDNRTAEAMVRALTSALNGCVYGVLYPMSGADVKRSAVRGTVTQALEIGRHIRLARRTSNEPVMEIVCFLDGRDDNRRAKLLFAGKIADVVHETRDGFHWGQVTIEAIGDRDNRMTVEIQNEFLVARRNGTTVAVVPDLLCILDTETAEPLTAEMLRYGARVSVVAYGAPPVLLTPESLKVVGPRQFGLPDTWKPFADPEAAPCN